MIRVSFPGLIPTLWQVSKNTGCMGILRGKFSIIRASFYWGVKNKELFLDKADVCKMQFMRGFKTVTKQVKKKSSWSSSETGAYKRTAQEKLWWTAGIFLIIGDSDSGHGHEGQIFDPFLYSRTSLIRRPKGQSKVSVLERCPLYRGHEYYVTLKAPLMVLSVL